MSGQTKSFVDKLGIRSARIPIKSKEAEVFTVNEPYILVCPSYAAGNQSFGVPKQVVKFLGNVSNRNNLLGVIAAGNRNFGDKYGIAGEQVATKCQVPLLMKFEITGTADEVQEARDGVDKYWDDLVVLMAVRNQVKPVDGVNRTITDGTTTLTH